MSDLKTKVFGRRKKGWLILSAQLLLVVLVVSIPLTIDYVNHIHYTKDIRSGQYQLTDYVSEAKVADAARPFCKKIASVYPTDAALTLAESRVAELQAVSTPAEARAFKATHGWFANWMPSNLTQFDAVVAYPEGFWDSIRALLFDGPKIVNEEVPDWRYYWEGSVVEIVENTCKIAPEYKRGETLYNDWSVAVNSVTDLAAN